MYKCVQIWVANNGKDACVLSDWQCICFQMAHSGRNSKGVCSVIAKSGNVTVSKSGTLWSCQEWQRCVLSNCQKWQCICFQIWHILSWQRCVLSDCQKWQCICFKSGTFWSCQEWQRCVLSDCRKWQ